MAVIRRALSEEAGTIRSLVRAAYAIYVPRIGREPSPMTDDYAAQIAAGIVWVVVDEHELAGVIVLEDTPKALQISNIAVRPDRQERGLGHQLLSFADSEAVRRGYRALVLYTNVHITENLARYPKVGYVEVGRGNDHGFDRVSSARNSCPETTQTLPRAPNEIRRRPGFRRRASPWRAPQSRGGGSSLRRRWRSALSKSASRAAHPAPTRCSSRPRPLSERPARRGLFPRPRRRRRVVEKRRGASPATPPLAARSGPR
jgi:GNAT superfamily N-acetyltransferase